MNVNVFGAPSGYRAEVKLTGDIQELLVGGQEFWIDEICVIEGEGPAPSECEYLVDYESQLMGTKFSAATGYSGGDLILTEDGIPVILDEITWNNGTTYLGEAEIVPSFSVAGNANSINLNNIANIFNISSLGIAVEKVTFEFVTYGGDENLQVNGATLFIGNLESAPMTIAPGVNYFSTTTAIPGGLHGQAVLYGDVHKLLIAGQELQIDNICVYEDFSTDECDNLSDNESLLLGAMWGSGYGDSPGDHIFTEDGIDVSVHEFDDTYSMMFNYALIATANAPIGTDNVMLTSNINLGYDFTGLGTVDSVTIDFFDGAGVENLQVNGSGLYVGEFEAMPANIATGVTLSVDYIDYTTYQVGTITLVGNVETLKIGGQQFYLDNVCAHTGSTVSDVTPGEYVTRRLELKANYPNPFNPSTTLMFSLSDEDHVRLTIHDVQGRIVRTLINNSRTAGSHQVVWDGRDNRNSAVATGLYFVRVETSIDVQTQKIALIK
ncbi:T9SS type A sorting domain-containing protein [bacterium]|nr:T9SS type A sorting domain-containing protein [bacterium]